jgi:hypothetical protein
MAVMMLPMTAMPIAPPTSRDRSLIAEAHPAAPEPGGQCGGQAGGGQHGRGHGQHADRSDESGVPPDDLQVLQEQEDEAVEREELDEDRQASCAQPGVGEQPRVQHRGVFPELIGDEPGQENQPEAEAGQGLAGQPSLGRGLDDRVHHGDQSQDGKYGAAAVQPWSAGIG